MRAQLPATVYVNDLEHLPLKLIDHLDAGLHERLRPCELVAPLASPSRAPDVPPPVRAHLVVSSNTQRAAACLVLNGCTLRLESGLDHPTEARLAPARGASPDETIDFVLRWLLGIDRLSRWRLAFEASLDDGVQAVVVVARGFEELEDVCRREGLEGVALVRGSAALLEREAAADPGDPVLTVVPCRGGLRGPIVAAVWPAQDDPSD